MRTKAAAQALFDAQERYFVADPSPAVAKICGGVADLTDIPRTGGNAGTLEPDPLAGFDADHPPPWVEEAARAREPFVPFVPAEAPAPAPQERAAAPLPPWKVVAISTGVVLLVGGALATLLFRRSNA